MHLARAQPLLAAVRAEVTGGQYLDIAAQTRRPLDARRDPESVLAQVRRVVEFKTARYTVVRPLQIGAALGGAGPELLAALGRYGSPLGRAFQYRDDVLGVFGDEAVTGKPAGDDLREGKLTVLIANAMGAASEAEAERLDALLGSALTEAEVAEARAIISGSGALAATEREIEEATAEALAALEGCRDRRTGARRPAAARPAGQPARRLSCLPDDQGVQFADRERPAAAVAARQRSRPPQRAPADLPVRGRGHPVVAFRQGRGQVGVAAHR